MKKVLVNIVTCQGEKIFEPWLINFKIFQSHGYEIHINAGIFTKKLGPIVDVNNFIWLSENEEKALIKDRVKTKTGFMLHALKRNYSVLSNNQKIFSNQDFDLIYTPSSVMDLVIYPYFLKVTGRKIKWATTLANIVPFSDSGNKIIRFIAWIFFQLSLRMIKKADVIFASTPEIRRYLLKKRFPENKVVETGFAVENEMIEKAKPVKDLKIDALFCGRINETKGIYDMLKVLKIIQSEISDFLFAIMGNGDERTKKEFVSKIKEMNLIGNVQFLGYRSGMDKYNIIKSAKSFWFLSTSQSESFGVALLEAVCSGIPAFTYNLPQFSWLYPNGEVDVSPMGNYRIVAEKVIKLFESGNFRNVKGEKLLGKYSWEAIAKTEYSAIEKLFL